MRIDIHRYADLCVTQQFRLCCKNGGAMVNSASIREEQRNSLHEQPESFQMASF